MNQNELSYLIATYVIIADEEINEKEYAILNDSIFPSDEVVCLQDRIFSDFPDKVSLKDLIKDYQELDDKDEDALFDLLCKVEYADGYADPREEKCINYVAESLDYNISKLELSRAHYACIKNDATSNIKLTWAESLTSAFKELIVSLKTEDEDSNDYSELLSGTSFAKKIKDIANIAQQDLSIAVSIMTDYNFKIQEKTKVIEKNIEQLQNTSKNNDDNIQTLVDQVLATYRWLQDEVRKNLDDNSIVLDKKKRTINYFTIAFMGRTKAGKSTFHKVVTHEDNDDIGVGKLRTTRYNRSFYWENLRIVDTPGIGAPGGKTDTETASSIIDEADLICYIVTDDSIQTTEFDFLRPLKERSKPLFIILNIKGDLDHPKRLEKFLANPLKWRESKGNDDIQGHFDRINEALNGKYDMSMVEVIPLQLYAAILMNQEGRFTAEEKACLLLGSNIQEYVRKVKASIYKTGSLKKTQNIYDGCAYQIHQVKTELQVQLSSINRDIELVDNALKNILDFVNKEKLKLNEKVETAISGTLSKLRNNARDFSEKYYDCKDNLPDKWKNYEDNKRAYSSLSNTIEKISRDFQDAVLAKIKECLDDIQIVNKSVPEVKIDPNLKGGNIIDFKFGATLIGSLITLAAPFVLPVLVSNPAGWMVFAFTALVGSITLGINKLFTSKEKRIAKAKEKMLNSLLKSIDENKPVMKEKYLKQFDKMVDDLKSQLKGSFGFVSKESKSIASDLNSLATISADYEATLVSMLIYRILQFMRVEGYNGEDGHNIDDIKNRCRGERIYEQSTLKILAPDNINPVTLDKASAITQISISQ
jgi:hypothetical protein